MTLPEATKLFQRFAIDAGTDAAARADFQPLVTDLVMVAFPDATTVEGAGGRDWGIDTVVGELAGGEVRLWQSKFVLKWQDKGPRAQVYSSYASAKKQAGKNGYSLKSWTLVVPCILAPAELKWFQGWAKPKLTADGVAVDLWDGPRLPGTVGPRGYDDPTEEVPPIRRCTRVTRGEHVDRREPHVQPQRSEGGEER